VYTAALVYLWVGVGVSRIVQLSQGDLSLAVDAAQGARIKVFALRGQNALFTGEPQWGSTFWPSPQASWGWPPPAALDHQPYRLVKQTAQQVKFRSAICEQTQLHLEKTFRLEPGCLALTYHLTNTAKVAQSFAPWEITRVAGGLTFFSSAQQPLAQSTLGAEFHQGAWWHSYDPALQGGQHLKLFANHTQGWLANVCDGLLLIKTFDCVAPEDVAPGEAEVEIYAHGDPKQPYIEIEQQGAYTHLKPEQSLSWSLRWYLKALPDSISPVVGSEQLLQLVAHCLNSH
jgi:hypothetical protein